MANTATVAAPVGGLNAIDSLAGMPSTDAIRLLNLCPTAYGCQVRRGSKQYAQALPDAVVSMFGVTNQQGAMKIFAGAAHAVYTIPDDGSAPTTLIATTTEDDWRSVIMTNVGGTHLLAVNGADDGIWYNADTSTLARLAAGDGVVSGTWKNVDPADLIQLTSHQKRIWAVEKNSTAAWYLAPDAVFGVANKFDFGSIFKRGGKLVALGTWSVDLGEGSDDMLVALSSEGELAAYSGIDVSDSTKWALKGLYYVGIPPKNVAHCMANVNGDLFILTSAGLVNMNSVLQQRSSEAVLESLTSRKIQPILARALRDNPTDKTWNVKYVPTDNLLYINVPGADNGRPGQLVADYTTKAWTAFGGYPATCWLVLGQAHYFGTASGKIFKAFVGALDAVALDGTGGQNILAAAQQAYNQFGTPGARKQVSLYRPNLLASKAVGTKTRLVYDYITADDSFPSNVQSGPGFDAYWDVAQWDLSFWDGNTPSFAVWRAGEGSGITVSLYISFSAVASVNWVATDFVFKIGGSL